MNDDEVLMIAEALRLQKDFNLAVTGTLIELIKLIEKPEKHIEAVNKIQSVLNTNSEFFAVVNKLPHPHTSAD